MPRARSDAPPSRTAAAFANQGGGCFTGYLLPPLAVLVIGTLLAIFALTVTPDTIPVKAASGSHIKNQILDSAVGAFIPDTTVQVGTGVNGTSDQSVNAIPRPPAAPPSAALQMTFPNQPILAASAGSSKLSAV